MSRQTRILALLGLIMTALSPAAPAAETPVQLARRFIAGVQKRDKKAQAATFDSRAWTRALVVGRDFASGQLAAHYISTISGRFGLAERIGYRPGVVYSADGARALVGLRSLDADSRAGSLYLLAAKTDDKWLLAGACLNVEAGLCYVASDVPRPLDETPAGILRDLARFTAQGDEKAARALYLGRAWAGPRGGSYQFQRANARKLQLVAVEAVPQTRPGGAENDAWAVVTDYVRGDGRLVRRRFQLLVHVDGAAKIAFVTGREDVTAAFLEGRFQPAIDIERLPESKEVRSLAENLLELAGTEEAPKTQDLFLDSKQLLQAWSHLRQGVKSGLKSRCTSAQAHEAIGKGLFVIEWGPDGEKGHGPKRPGAPSPIHVRCLKTDAGWRIVGPANSETGAFLWLTMQGGGKVEQGHDH